MEAASREAWEAWRRERMERLRARRGWLSVVGLHWLAPGENRVEGVPGLFTVGDEGVRRDGRPAGGILDLGGGREAQVIVRSGRHALRVWDRHADALRDLAGIEAFPFDPAWVVEAGWEPFHPPRRVTVLDVTGAGTDRDVPGRAVFEREGRRLSLEPTADGARLAFVFRDRTAGVETYGAGRFLDADAPREGRLVLDFNRAVNPPCAFTPFATCPLPRPENVLPVRVTAGERLPAWR